MAWTTGDWIHLSNIIEASVYFALGCILFALAYILLNPTRLRGMRTTALVYSKAYALTIGFGCMTCAMVAFARTLGFDSVSETLTEGVPDTVLGVKVYDLRIVSTGLWLIFMAAATAQYLALPLFESLIYWLAYAAWAVFMGLLMHSQSFTAVLGVSLASLVIFFSIIASTFTLSRVQFYLQDWRAWLMFSFLFGSMLTDMVILLLSCPYAVSNWGVMGLVWPEWIYWVLQAFATIVFASMGLWGFQYRYPIGGDYSLFYPGRTDAGVTQAIINLLAAGQLISKDQMEMYLADVAKNQNAAAVATRLQQREAAEGAAVPSESNFYRAFAA